MCAKFRFINQPPSLFAYAHLLNPYPMAVFDPQLAEGSPLLNLAKDVGHVLADWLPYCLEALPETLRVNPLREDSQWTRKQLELMGGETYSWYSDAYKMPWQRGIIPDEHRDLFIALHQTGRITRQEAASMLPVLCLQPKPNERVLDMCASPGSKTTQISEMMRDSGVLVANDVSSSRLNTLVSNRSRLGTLNTILCRHDGRHFPAVPDPGFDAILVDAPCTGSATMRKNRHVWENWKEDSGWSLRRLQVDILKRACSLLKPGGRIVYSTCSFDPIENEGVIAQIISELDYMEIELIDSEKLFPGLKLRAGITNWEDEKSNWNDDRLNMTLRLAPEDNDTGGFFFALLKHVGGDETAKALLPKIPRSEMNEVPPSSADLRLPSPADEVDISTLADTWQLDKSKYSWWKRGKKYSLSTPEVKNWLWDSKRTVKRRMIQSGGGWRPLNVIHAGATAFQPSKGGLRPRSEVKPLFDKLEFSTHSVTDSLIFELLQQGDTVSELTDEIQGFAILSCPSGLLVPVWSGQHLSLMIDQSERLILLRQLKIKTEDSSL